MVLFLLLSFLWFLNAKYLLIDTKDKILRSKPITGDVFALDPNIYDLGWWGIEKGSWQGLCLVGHQYGGKGGDKTEEYEKQTWTF